MDGNSVKKPPTDFRGVIALWPSRSTLAADLGEAHWLVEAWHRKNSIPPRWFDPVTRAAIKRDIEGVSNDSLLRLHVQRMEQGPSAPPSKKNTAVKAVGVDA